MDALHWMLLRRPKPSTDGGTSDGEGGRVHCKTDEDSASKEKFNGNAARNKSCYSHRSREHYSKPHQPLLPTYAPNTCRKRRAEAALRN